MEHAQPSYTAPTYTSPAYTAPAYQAPQMPMPMPMPQQQPVYQQPLSPKAMMTMPMAMPMPAPVVHHKPSHTDIHLHTSYQQTTFIVPPPRPKPVLISCYNDVGAVLVLFILLVIITRCFPRF